MNWRYTILIGCLVTALLIGSFFFLRRSKIEIEDSPEKNPLACALVVAKAVESEDSKHRVLKQLARNFAQVGRFEKANQIVYLMNDSEYIAQTLAQIGDCYFELGQRDACLSKLNQALKIAQTMTDGYHKGLTLEEIAEVYAKAGDCEKAVNISGDIEWATHRSKAAIQIANNCTREGKIQETDKVLLQAIEKIREENDDTDSRFAEIAVKYAEAGEFEQAEALTKKTSQAYALQTFVKIAREYVKKGHLDKAISTAERIMYIPDSPNPLYDKSEILGEIGVQCIESDQYDNARQLINVIHYAQDKAKVLIAIAAYKIKLDEITEAHTFLLQATSKLNSVESDYSEIVSYIQIAARYFEMGERGKSLEILNRACAAARRIDWSYNEERALRELASQYAMIGDYDKAIEVADELPMTNSSQGYWFIAEICSKIEQREKAMELLSRFSARVKRKDDDFLSFLATMYAEQGEYNQALQLIKAMKSLYIKAETLGEIGIKFEKTKQKPDEVMQRLLKEITRSAIEQDY